MFGGMSGVFRKIATMALVCGIFVGVGLTLHAFMPAIAFAESGSTSGSFNYPAGFTNWIGGIIATFANFIGDAVGSLTLLLIEIVVINILNYNNFSASSIVTLGWIITRDMVNMFAVIVLLILAVKTMISRNVGAWQQHLPRFFLGIVFANFSRTICGLAVDASQVVMMTFVNALMAIAAGNFAQLMVMPQVTSYSEVTFRTFTEEGQTAISLATNIANAYVKILVQVTVMIVILLLAIAFLWRIVILWIAFIMAPLAGFSWGSMDIVKFLGRFWTEWVGSFVPPLILGPMLTFFLYLALAASSNGNLAKAEAFPEPKEQTTKGIINLEVFESTNFTGLLIAVVFLVLGIRESAKVSAKMGGLAAMALNEKTTGRVFRMGRTISGKALGAPISVARLGSQVAGRGLGTAAGLAPTGSRLQNVLKGGQKLTSLTTKGLQYAESPLEASMRGGKNITKFTGKALGAVGAATGLDSLMKAGSAIDAQLHTFDEKDKKAAKERVSHMDDTQKVARLMNAVNGTGEVTNDILADAQTLRGEIFTNKDFAKQLRAKVGDKKFEEIVQNTLHEFDHDESHRSIDKDAWNKARSQYVDLYARAGGDVGKFIDSEDFSGRLMRKEAVTEAAVVAALGAASTGKTENGRVITKLDELYRGSYGGESVRAAVPGAADSGNVDSITKLMGRGGAASLSTASLNNAAVIQGIIQGNAARGDIASEEIAAVVARRREAARRAGTLASFDPVAEEARIREVVQRQFTTNIMSTQDVENITKAFSNGQFNETHIDDAMFGASNPNADKAVRALARAANFDFSKLSSDARDQITARLVDMEGSDDRISADDASEIRKKLIAAGKTVSDVIPGIDLQNNTNLTLAEKDRMKMQQLFKTDPSTIRQVSSAVDQGRNAFTEAVVENLSKEDFQKLSESIRKETNTERKRAIREAMATIDKALSVYETDFADALAALEARRASATREEKKEIEKQISEFKKSDEYQKVRRSRNDYNAASRYMT